MKRKKRIGSVIKFFMLSCIAFITIYPLYFTLISAFKDENEYFRNMFGFPQVWTMENFVHFFEQYSVFTMFKNSVIVVVIPLVAVILISSLAGFVFAKYRFKWSERVLSFIISFMMVPPMVLLIPVFLLMAKLGLVNNSLSLILFYIAFYMPFSVYLMTANFKSIPDECIESAQIDGAGMFRIYWSIGIPLCRPTIMTLFTLNFLWCWNEFLYSMMLLQKPDVRTLTVGVATVIGKNQMDMPLLYTGLLVNIIPVLILFIVCQKYLQKGLIAGAVKG